MKTKIIFICLGNICRSPAAQGVMQRLVEERGMDDKFEIDSAGTYSGHHGQLPDPRMRRHASRRGYNLTHRARPITSDDLDHFDIIVAMDESNRRNIASKLQIHSPAGLTIYAIINNLVDITSVKL